MKYFFCSILFVLLMNQCRNKPEPLIAEFPGKPDVPSSIKAEHKYLLDQIRKISLFRDSTGIVATKLRDLMQHHFQEEEDFVLPALGLLPLLASGQVPEQRKELIRFTEEFKLQLTHLDVEHQLISAYVKELKQVATKENNVAVIEFENDLHKHAMSEEEIFFPAAVLIGEYLKLKSVEMQ